jgi:hypothetical protein
VQFKIQALVLYLMRKVGMRLAHGKIPHAFAREKSKQGESDQMTPNIRRFVVHTKERSESLAKSKALSISVRNVRISSAQTRD